MKPREEGAGGHYAALGVPAGATQRTIELAFAGWRNRLSAGGVQPESFRRAESAYQVLSAPAARARHDRQLGLCPHPAWAAAGQRRARSLSRRGVWNLSHGRPATARPLLERAAALCPADPLARSYLALALARVRADLHEAARHGEFAVECRPGEAAFLFNLAEVYGAAGLRGRAVRTRVLAWRAAAVQLVKGPARRV
jgi:tetratricopeptide (TPR) repeat protein